MGNGNVTSVDPSTKTFTWTASQYFTGSDPNESIAVHAIVTDDTLCTPKDEDLPMHHGLVSFTGRLKFFDDAVPPRATVVLNSLTFLTL